MKPICLSLILYLICSLSGHTNPLENAEAVLMEEVVLQEDQQQLKAQLTEKNKKEVTLIGQVRATSIPTQKDSKVVQVVWTALQGKDKKRALFKEPLISTFKSGKGSLSKGLKISLYGNKAHLSEALTRLEKGEDDQINEIKADNPSSNERRLEDVDGRVKKSSSLRNLSGLDAYNSENPFPNNTSLSAATESYRSDSASSYGERKNADVLIRKPANNQNNLSIRRPSNSLRGGNSRGAHLSGSPSSVPMPSTSPLNSSATSSTSSPNTHPDFEGSLDEEFDPLRVNQGDTSEVEEFEMPLIEVEVTKEGCTPRIDLERGKVIIQTRSIAKTNGTITHETQCTDSHLIFDIKKDYGCCADKLDEGSRVAYTAFKRYYLDDGYNKVYVDADCLNDESQPHPFIEEKGVCPQDINLQSRHAFPQAETVYYDRSNARKVVKGCHRSDAQPLLIISTEEGCSLKHLYEQNKSLIQKKEVFVDNGVVHEVVPCHETNESLPHQFVKSGCKPLISGSQVTPMAKRQVIHKGKKKIINDQCEPQDLTHLQTTKVGCEGQYEHDFSSGRSYPLARHYYQWGGKKRFIDKTCRRSDEPIPHHLSIIGYEHVDSELKSKPRYQISIKDSITLLMIKEFTEKDETKWLPYTFVKTVTGEVDGYPPSQQGEYIVFPQGNYSIYTRPDSTTYKVFANWASSISVKAVTTINQTTVHHSGGGYDPRYSRPDSK